MIRRRKPGNINNLGGLSWKLVGGVGQLGHVPGEKESTLTEFRVTSEKVLEWRK